MNSPDHHDEQWDTNLDRIATALERLADHFAGPPRNPDTAAVLPRSVRTPDHLKPFHF